MRKSYTARILNIDLSLGKVKPTPVDAELTRKYIGGAGLATKILWDRATAQTDPFSPENCLIFMLGPLTGTAVPMSGRHVVAGISPLTGILGQAHSGGNWADELRHSGCEGIVITGKSAKPVYLWIHNGEAEIRDASHLWGKDTFAVDGLLRRETNEKASVAAIGPAGEKLVKIACVMNDGKMGRAAARCGLGALMGSKQLKAIVVRGTLPILVSDKEALKRRVNQIYAARPPRPKDDHELIEREISVFKGFIRDGGAPIMNWRKGEFESGYRIAEALREAKPMFCRHCPFGCAESKLNQQGERHMVWESWAPLGTNCLIDNIDALQEAFSLCNRYGMDTISVGGVIAFAMECYEKGLVTKKDTGGLDLSWGNHQALLEMVRQIGERQGLGELLGEGVRRAAENIGGIAQEYALHVKGLELPAHDPRAATGYAVEYATGSIGATHIEAYGHNRIESYVSDYYNNPKLLLQVNRDFGYTSPLDRFETKGKGEMIAKQQDFGCMLNSLVVCAMLASRVTASDLVELLNDATGWDLNLAEFMRTGERIFNLRRLFNGRRGVSRIDDTLPPRILTHKRGEGGAADNLPHLGAMLSEYYGYRGWSEEGTPTREKLLELGLNEYL